MRWAALALLVVLASGCGGSPAAVNPPPAGSNVAFAACMSSHGVPASAQPNGGMVIGGDAGSPAFGRAQAACKSLLPVGGTSRPPVSNAQKRTLLAFAACMRRNGLPDWSDPTFPPGGGVMSGGSSGYSKGSPVVQRAALICNKASSTR